MPSSVSCTRLVGKNTRICQKQLTLVELNSIVLNSAGDCNDSSLILRSRSLQNFIPEAGKLLPWNLIAFFLDVESFFPGASFFLKHEILFHKS